MSSSRLYGVVGAFSYLVRKVSARPRVTWLESVWLVEPPSELDRLAVVPRVRAVPAREAGP